MPSFLAYQDEQDRQDSFIYVCIANSINLAEIDNTQLGRDAKQNMSN